MGSGAARFSGVCAPEEGVDKGERLGGWKILYIIYDSGVRVASLPQGLTGSGSRTVWHIIS